MQPFKTARELIAAENKTQSIFPRDFLIRPSMGKLGSMDLCCVVANLGSLSGKLLVRAGRIELFESDTKIHRSPTSYETQSLNVLLRYKTVLEQCSCAYTFRFAAVSTDSAYCYSSVYQFTWSISGSVQLNC